MSDKISYVSLRTGAVLAVLAMTAILFSCASSQVRGPVPRTLVIGLDGVPYTTFKKLQDGGHFRNFQSVAPMIASFPSISDPNWTRLFNLKPEAGFTKAYFDPTIKTPSGFGLENGSLMAHLSREPLYEQVMDFKADGAGQHLSMFIWTETTAKYWLKSLEKKFFAFSGRNTYFALIINTDLISHTEGEPALMRYLSEVEATIDEIQRRYKDQYGGDLEVVLLSDHGNGFFSPQDITLEDGLIKQGWNLAPTIAGPRDVGFYVPEMLSFGSFFCQPQATSALATALSRISKIQSTMYEDQKGIHVLNGGTSESLINVDAAARTVNFKVLKGVDPYGQAKLFKNGNLSFDDYFQKTLQDVYPNALVRIWEGFHQNSQIKPQVLANAQLGYVFGNKTLRLMTSIRGFASSHGSLHRDESLGIFTSTKSALPAVRPQDVGRYVHMNELSDGPAFTSLTSQF
jgi:hypothetical protein